MTPTCQRRRKASGHRSGFIVCPSATPWSPSSLLPSSKLHHCTVTHRRQNESIDVGDAERNRLRKDMCVLACIYGQTDFHLTSAVAAGRTHKLSIPRWSSLPLSSSHFHSTSDTHSSVLTNVRFGSKSYRLLLQRKTLFSEQRLPPR